MTVTNEERREIAARLRRCAPIYRHKGEYPDMAGGLVAITGTSLNNLFYRLVDLIEPEERVCRWRHIEGTWFMSECGKRYDCVVPDNFCSNCGAKVVE